MQKSRFTSIILWLCKGLILAVVLWLVFILAGRALRQIAIGQIIELTNAKVEAKSVDFKLDGSVFIEKLVIRPYQKQKYDDTILKAETVYARFGKVSLLLLRPRLKEISVNDFVFDVQYDLDTGRWNVAALKIKAPGGGFGEMPLVRLERGRLQYSKVSGGRAEVAAALPLDARFGPAEEPRDGYQFNITTAERAEFGKSTLTGFWQPGMITISGGISSADMPAFERSWTINVLAAELNYDQSNTYSLKLSTKDLLSAHSPSPDTSALVKPAFLKKTNPFTALQRFFNRYHPAGRVDIDLEASGNLQQLAESTLRGKVYCKDVSIWDRKFPYRIEHIAGQIDLTENSAVLKNLCGRHGEVEVTFNGWSENFGPNWRYQIQITSDNMALDNDLYNALSTRWKKLWSLFSPSGLAAINYCLARRSATDKERVLAVKLLDAEAVYQKFPYPLKNLTGNLFFDRDSATFSDVVSQVNEHKIVVNGKAITAGTDRPVYDVTIDVNNIPLDSTLQAALPDRQRELYAQFRPTGLADGEIKVFASKQDVSPAGFIADLCFRKSSLESTQIPLAVSDISAKAVFTDDSIRINSFTGRHAEGLLCLTGQIWPGEKGELRYSLTLNARQAQLNDELFDLLPKPLKKNVLEFQPQGRVNYIADLDKADSNGHPDYRITLDCLGNSVNYRRFPYPLKDVTGRLMITKDSIELSDITATSADSLRIAPETSAIKLNGEIALTDNAFSSGRFQLDADNVLFDEQLSVALPEGIKPFYRKLSPTGRFDVNSADIKISIVEDSQKYIDFDGIVKFKVCDFNLPGVVTELTGELETKGVYKTGGGFRSGRAILSADRLRIGGKAFTNLKADVYYDDGRQNWFTKNLVADCYGGRLTGKFELKQLAEVAPEYLLQAGFGNIDLKQFLSDAKPKETSENSDTSGKMSGSLSMSGRIGDDYSRIGRCRLAISDMQVGKLSPLAKMLSVLKLTEPEDFAFERMLINSYINRNRLFFKQFDLSGESVAFNGSGWMDLQSQNVDLILTARGRRLATAEPSVFQSLTDALGTGVVRMEVTGNVYDPQVETTTLPVIKDALEILGADR